MQNLHYFIIPTTYLYNFKLMCCEKLENIKCYLHYLYLEFSNPYHYGFVNINFKNLPILKF